MKKLFYLLMMLPLAFLASCSDGDDLPEVDLTITLSGVTIHGDVFYAVKGGVEEDTPASEDGEPGKIPGDVITIVGLTATSLTSGNATVANVLYYLDGLVVPISFDYLPLACRFSTKHLNLGLHTISATANVLQEDKSIASAALNYRLRIVESKDDLPADAPEIGTYSMTTRMQAVN